MSAEPVNFGKHSPAATMDKVKKTVFLPVEKGKTLYLAPGLAAGQINKHSRKNNYLFLIK